MSESKMNTSICVKPEGCLRQINEKIEAIVCLNYGNAKRIHLKEFNFILINIWNVNLSDVFSCFESQAKDIV